MIHHTFRSYPEDNLKPGVKATTSLARDGVNKLIPRDRYTGLELIKLVASPQVSAAYQLLGIIIDCAYYSGYRDYVQVRNGLPYEGDGFGEAVMPEGPTHKYIKRSFSDANSIFKAESISGPIHPFWIPRGHHIALHYKCLKDGILFRAEASFAAA
jgi:hypothetical protein